MLFRLSLAMCCLIYSMIHGQIDPEHIDIVRDAYGVPHLTPDMKMRLVMNIKK